MHSISLLSHSVQAPKLLLQSCQASLPLPSWKLTVCTSFKSQPPIFCLIKWAEFTRLRQWQQKPFQWSPINTHSPNSTARVHELQLIGQWSGNPGDNILHLSQGSWNPVKTFSIGRQSHREICERSFKPLGTQFAFVSRAHQMFISFETVIWESSGILLKIFSKEKSPNSETDFGIEMLFVALLVFENRPDFFFKREKEKERNISWLPLARPQLGTWVPGTQPATFQFTGQCSTHRATPARAQISFNRRI